MKSSERLRALRPLGTSCATECLAVIRPEDFKRSKENIGLRLAGPLGLSTSERSSEECTEHSELSPDGMETLLSRLSDEINRDFDE